jgi:hypothetical protein
MTCPHARKEYVLVIGHDGRKQVMELCRDCGANARGAGHWVPQHTLPVNPDLLRVHKDYRPSARAADQGLLF